MTETKIKIITENRKARHDYNIVEAMEAGIELAGTEVKSLRAGKVNLKDSFVRVTKKGELVVMNMHISPYDFGNYNNHEPLRTRRLLMHRREIDRLHQELDAVRNSSSFKLGSTLSKPLNKLRGKP